MFVDSTLFLRLARKFASKKTVLLVPILLTQLNCGTKSDSNEDAQVEGYFVKESEVSKDRRINPSTSISNFSSYIRRQRPKNSWLSPEDLAKKIIIVSDCFQIDPYMLAGLMKVESRYMPEAVSPTGAVGLTQFTGVAIDEVHDQTGRRGASHATPGVTSYFNKVLDGCIKTNLTGESGIILWRHTSNVSSMKTQLMEKPDLSIIYGATLLKTYLAFRARSGQSAVDTYNLALQQYNGEPGDRKVRYAKNVIAAARAIGLDSKISDNEGTSDTYGDAAGAASPKPPQAKPGQPNTPTPSSQGPFDTDPDAYEIYLMYMDGMEGGRIELKNKVLDMQTRLKNLGYSLTPDGKYGDETAVAVAKFQKDHKHIVDGFGLRVKDWKLLQ